jgi:DNA-binding MarR family transcriptional regulator
MGAWANLSKQEDILLLLKTLADEHRLRMLSLMNGQERTVTEMAELLDRSEPTVSHHVSKLHQAGLLRLRMAGNQRFYSVNEQRLAQFKSHMTEIEKIPDAPEAEKSDNAWIDALDMTPVEKKVLLDYTFNGRLKRLPMKEKKWLVVLRWLATRFKTGRHYTEKEVNAILTEIHPDYAVLRRNLVDYGFMRRERGGGDYWLTPEEE